jgi:transposase
MPAEPEPGKAGGRPSRRSRRRWSTEEKVAIVRESFAPGVPVSRVARYYGIAPNLLFTWRRLYADAAPRELSGGEAPVPRSRYRALERQFRELEWLLGKKTLENEMLRQALSLAEATLRRHRAPPYDDVS